MIGRKRNLMAGKQATEYFSVDNIARISINSSGGTTATATTTGGEAEKHHSELNVVMKCGTVWVVKSGENVEELANRFMDSIRNNAQKQAVNSNFWTLTGLALVAAVCVGYAVGSKTTVHFSSRFKD